MGGWFIIKLIWFCRFKVIIDVFVLGFGLKYVINLFKYDML